MSDASALIVILPPARAGSLAAKRDRFRYTVGGKQAYAAMRSLTVGVVPLIAASVVAPIVLTSILILANPRTVPGGALNSPAFRIAATTAVTPVAGMSLLLVGQTLLGVLGVD